MMIRNSTKIVFKTLTPLTERQWIQKLPVRYNSSAVTNSLINVEVNDKSGIAVVTMNRKPVNGLSLELLDALSNTLDELESNKTRGAILTSVRRLNYLLCCYAGGLAFCKIFLFVNLPHAFALFSSTASRFGTLRT